MRHAAGKSQSWSTAGRAGDWSGGGGVETADFCLWFVWYGVMMEGCCVDGQRQSEVLDCGVEVWRVICLSVPWLGVGGGGREREGKGLDGSIGGGGWWERAGGRRGRGGGKERERLDTDTEGRARYGMLGTVRSTCMVCGLLRERTSIGVLEDGRCDGILRRRLMG